MSVENINGTIPSTTLTTEFNDFGKIRNIQDGNTLCKVDFVYGHEMLNDFSLWWRRYCNHAFVVYDKSVASFEM